MQCYSQIVPASGVTNSLALPFTAANATNLVVARTSVLQIYEKKSSGLDTRLVLISQHHLAGTITNLGRVHIESSKSGGDAIFVSFRDAKLSLVEWDASQHTISTISIHYYENHNLQSAPWLPELRDCVSHLTVDPNSRCAAFNFGVTNLAIVPFHQKPDDLAMDDDLGDIEDEDSTRPASLGENGTVMGHKTPYYPSFVLPLTALDPSLLHPVDLSFLHEYRDPTIGILYSTAARSSNLASERKDVTIYSMYALDIEQRASTNLQSVHNLPNDIHTVKALPLPVGGSLLIGGNELIHIDQGGKTTGIGVNEFAREASAFPLTDQSHHQMRLEGCQVAQLDQSSGDMLIVLRTGQLVILSFRLDGRSVAGLSLRRLNDDVLYSAVCGRSSCTSTLGSGEVFVGSDEADSVLLGNTSRPGPLKRQLSRVQSALNGHDLHSNGNEDADEMEEDDDDDIFATTNGQTSNTAAPSDAHITVLDSLPSIAPLHGNAFGRATKRKREDDEINQETRMSEGLELAVSYGRGRSGGIAFFSQNLLPSLKRSLKHGRANTIWPCYHDTDSSPRFIISENTESDGLSSSVWSINEGQMNQVRDTEFPVKGEPIAVGVFTSLQKTIYVTGSEVRVYDLELAISQILPIVDEDEGQLARAINADFAEPYLTVLKDDQTLMILKADKNGELEELELPKSISGLSLLSASLYVDSVDFFQSSRFHTDAAVPGVLLVLLTRAGALWIVPLSNPEVQIFRFDSAHFLTTQFGHDVRIEKHWRNGDELASAMLGDIGDGPDMRPYLVIRNTTGDIILYKPFALPDVIGSYKFRKVATRNAEYNNKSAPEEDGEAEPTLPPMQTIVSSGCSAIYVPGDKPLIITKTASGPAQIYPFGNGDIVSLCPLRQKTDADLVYVDNTGNIRQASLPTDLILEVSPWVAQRKRLGSEVISLAYYEGTSSYVIATHTPAPFRLPQEDEWHPEWASEKTDFLPTTSTSKIQLISSITHNVISQHVFDVDERVLDVKTMSLETSEITHRQQELVVVGTGTVKGENIVTRGHIYLFAVAEVVPRTGVPESDLKLKLLSTEEVRGAVTALTSIGSQGFVLAAQGQKCMVRGLREDLSILPVAFMDMRFYTAISKSLPGTGLCILGDALSGLWLVGYSEEPYKLQLLSRDLDNPSVVSADFLPSDDNKELYVIASDDDGDLRILQYDPENPKSERGQKLLLRSNFHTGDFPTGMNLIPRSPTSYEAAINADEASTPQSDDAMAVDLPAMKSKSQLLITNASGAISLMTTLDEASYRRLSALQNILISNMDHPCGLNPRAFRAVETDGMGGRGVIDGDVVKRWLELNSHHKANTADKAGARAVWEVRGDLEIVLGGGIAFMA